MRKLRLELWYVYWVSVRKRISERVSERPSSSRYSIKMVSGGMSAVVNTPRPLHNREFVRRRPSHAVLSFNRIRWRCGICGMLGRSETVGLSGLWVGRRYMGRCGRTEGELVGSRIAGDGKRFCSSGGCRGGWRGRRGVCWGDGPGACWRG